jgi:acyl-coenzyme A thioesterase PaaI-like protein
MTAQPESSDGPVDDGACYACGPHNPDGLRLRFEPDGVDGARATVTLDRHLQGYRGIAHGGIVMLLLDEVMAHASGNAGEKVVTAAVAVRFRAPVPLGVPLAFEGRVRSKRGKILKVEGFVRDTAGVLLASAEGSFASVGPVEPGRFGNFAAPETV